MEYMKELETSSNDIRELDEKLDVKFACDDSLIHALGIGGAALAGTAAPPQGGDLAAAWAMAALLCSMGGCTSFLVNNAIVAKIVDKLKIRKSLP